jgi:uncharacterized protein
MRVTRYMAASDFLAHTQTLLERRESFNNLIFGICDRLINKPQHYPHYFLWTVDSEQGVTIAALLTLPYDLVIYAESLDLMAIRLLAQYLHNQKMALPGVVGAAETVHAFADVWSNLTGENKWVRRHSRIYELRHVLFPIAVQGRCIQAEPEHRAVVCPWFYDFHHGKVAKEEVEQITDFHITNHTMCLWEVDDKPVSMAVGPTHQSQRGGTINFVYTPPEHRRNGYASAVVAALSQRILDSGKEFCTLFTNLANPTSNSIYQKIGYVPCGDFDELKFGTRA